MSGAVVRGDNEPVVIGDDTNIQENCVLHTDPGLPLTLGKGVTVGHQVMLHGCTIGDGTLIGIQAVVLNNSVIGKDCLIGAGAVIIENKSFADRSVIFGSPAKAVREVSEDNVTRMRTSAEDYVKRGSQYKKDLKRIG
jgi:carbonic anhydrase/acetyltransferase-like protein (isoleucine patch superfamily)